jgi:hypothetical protein
MSKNPFKSFGRAAGFAVMAVVAAVVARAIWADAAAAPRLIAKFDAALIGVLAAGMKVLCVAAGMLAALGDALTALAAHLC